MRAAREAARGRDRDALDRFFTLGPDDLALLEATRRDSHRLALGLALVWARAERSLALDPASLPPALIAHVAAQLGLRAQVLADYTGWPSTRAADSLTVRRHLGLRSFVAGDAEALAAEILRERRLPDDERLEMGRRARQFAERRRSTGATRVALTALYEQTLARACTTATSRPTP
ncbi:MAG: DUF4158 domain-containing protein, partial [Acidimicrobiales bacterium]